MNKLVTWMVSLALAGCAFDAAPDDDEQSVAELSEGLVKNALTKVEQATALKLIDDICGDTWCSGDHNFSFDRLECRAGCAERPGSCKMTFRVFAYDTDVETGPTYTRSCTTPGFTGFDSLVKTIRGRQSLQPEYYDALTECINRVEDRLPKVPPAPLP